jgi:hypothetical protein
VPALVWLHLALVVLLTFYLGYHDFNRPTRYYDWQSTQEQQRLQSGFFWVRSFVLTPLYVAFLGRRNWARIAVGVLTLPLGLLVLIPRNVRIFTGAVEEPKLDISKGDGPVL